MASPGHHGCCGSRSRSVKSIRDCATLSAQGVKRTLRIGLSRPAALLRNGGLTIATPRTHSSRRVCTDDRYAPQASVREPRTSLPSRIRGSFASHGERTDCFRSPPVAATSVVPSRRPGANATTSAVTAACLLGPLEAWSPASALTTASAGEQASMPAPASLSQRTTTSLRATRAGLLPRPGGPRVAAPRPRRR